MQSLPSLSDQIFNILDNDPTKKYSIEDIIKQLKSTPQKREVIKMLNYLITNKKIARIEEEEKKFYKTIAFVPENVSSSNETKILFMNVENDDDTLVKELSKKTWRKFRIYGCANLNYKGYGPRDADTEYFRILQHKFSNSNIQLSWLIQDKLNELKNIQDISIALKGKDKESLETISELVENKGFKVVINPSIKDWINK